MIQTLGVIGGFIFLLLLIGIFIICIDAVIHYTRPEKMPPDFRPGDHYTGPRWYRHMGE